MGVIDLFLYTIMNDPKSGVGPEHANGWVQN